jgi:hypothetical protein
MAKNTYFPGLILLFILAVCAPYDAYSGRNSEDLRKCLQETFVSQIGVSEKGGNNCGPEVEMYQQSCKAPKGSHWCAAFTHWVLQQCGLKGAGSWAASWFSTKYLIYQRGKFSKSIPQAGDLVGFFYRNLGRIGHIGFVDKWGDKWIITVEGNTNSAGSRTGDAVQRKWRLKSQIYAVANWVDGNKK